MIKYASHNEAVLLDHVRMSAGFETYLLAQGLADRSVLNLSRKLLYCLKQLSELTTEQVELFVVKERKRGLSNASINKYFQALRHYVAWREIKGVKIPKSFKEHSRSPETISDTKIEQIVALKDNKYSAFLAVLAYTGMRPGEAIKLTDTDIDKVTETIRIRDTKTYSDRIIPISSPLKPFLNNFTSFNFSLDSARIELKKRCKKLGISPSPLYALRHSYITRIVDSDVNLLVVKSLAGTQSKAIERYYHSNLKKLRAAVNSDRLVIASMNAADILKSFIKFVRQFPFGDKVSVEIQESEDEIVVRVKKRKPA